VHASIERGKRDRRERPGLSAAGYIFRRFLRLRIEEGLLMGRLPRNIRSTREEYPRYYHGPAAFGAGKFRKIAGAYRIVSIG